MYDLERYATPPRGYNSWLDYWKGNSIFPMPSLCSCKKDWDKYVKVDQHEELNNGKKEYYTEISLWEDKIIYSIKKDSHDDCTKYILLLNLFVNFQFLPLTEKYKKRGICMILHFNIYNDKPTDIKSHDL